MEICTMDKHPTSQFYRGIGPNKMRNNINYDMLGDENYSVPFSANASSAQQNVESQCTDVSMNVQYQENLSDNNWKAETLECKQEIDQMPTTDYLHSRSNNIDMNTNYGPDNYNDTFHYGYGNPQSASYYASNSDSGGESSSHCHSHQQNMQQQQQHYRNNGNNISNYSPYQLSAAAKSQLSLPAWYNPPPTAPIAAAPSHSSYYKSPNFFPHQPPYQTNYMAPATTSSEHNMRNMIQMTNR